MSINHPAAEIEGLFRTFDPQDFVTSPVERFNLLLDPNGIENDFRHAGNAMIADVRSSVYQRGVDEVLNRQTVSLIGSEDMDFIAEELELSWEELFHAEAARCPDDQPSNYLSRMVEDIRTFEDPNRITRRFLAQCLGANILLSNFRPTEQVKGFRELPRGVDFGLFNPTSRKIVGGSVFITRPNDPCIGPGKKIEDRYPGESTDLAKRFVKAAQGRRGYVGMVAMAGPMTVRNHVEFVPYGE